MTFLGSVRRRSVPYPDRRRYCMRMTRARRYLSLLIGGILLIGVLVLAPQLLSPERANLVVLCSNEASVCQALASTYGAKTGEHVRVVRVPTSEALGRLAAARTDSEFDLWLGGPAEAHAEAERLGLLARPRNIDTSHIPSAFHSPSWFGIYGGILSFCTSTTGAESPTPASVSSTASPATSELTWSGLARSTASIIAPLPLTSGTAATMLNAQTERLGGIDAALPFLRRLDRHISTYTESGTDPAHLVAIGRATLAISFDTYCELERSRGAPVRTVYPADGTGFEVGAASIPRAGKHRHSALSFLAWVVSDEGQRLASSVLGQAPISTRLSGNLSSQLDDLQIPVYGRAPAQASLLRREQIGAWEANVYAPTPCSDSSATAESTCAKTPRVPAGRISLAPTVARTLLLAALAGATAATMGALIALMVRFGPRPTAFALPLVALPALVPAAVTAEVLVALGAAPYRPSTLGMALALNAMPFAALIETYALGSLTRDELHAARNLGARPPMITTHIVIPALARGILPAFAVATLMAASDVSATTVFGGSEPYLASLARHSLNAGHDAAIPVRILFVFLTAAALTTAILLRWVRLGGSRQWAPIRQRTGTNLSFDPHSFRFSTPLAVLCALVLIGAQILVAANASALGSGSHVLTNAITESSVILLLVVPLSALVGLIGALVENRRQILNAFALFVLLSAPVAGGILVRLVLSLPLLVGGHILIPSLIGGGAPVGGLIAVVLASLLLMTPAAYFLMTFALSGTGDVRRVAENLGARRARTVLRILVPMRRGRILAAIAALSALTMTMSAPAVFVFPAGSAFPAVALVPYGTHGSLGEVLLFGTLGSASALAMILLGIAALATASARRSHD